MAFRVTPPTLTRVHDGIHHSSSPAVSRRIGVFLLTLAAALGAPRAGAAVAPAAGPEVERLRAELARHDASYFRDGAPEISDSQYDALRRRLDALEADQGNGDAPAPAGGDDRSGRLPTARHGVRMLGLHKSYTESGWRSFAHEAAARLGHAAPIWIAEPKYDGVAVSLLYEEGRFVRALTRGNGVEGDDVSAGVREAEGFCALLRETDAAPPQRVELRGEILVRRPEFERLNEERDALGTTPAAHPRNLAVAGLRAPDTPVREGWSLSLVIHGWGLWEGSNPPATERDFLRQVGKWALAPAELLASSTDAGAIWTAVQQAAAGATTGEWPLDGVVVKLDAVADRPALGADALGPGWALACKFASPRAFTRLRGVTWQVSRAGVLTPVAELDAVEVGGSRIHRATLHNPARLAQLGLRIGDRVEVERAGDVIPALVAIDEASRSGAIPPIGPPSVCPGCGGAVTVEAPAQTIRCPNRDCPARVERRLLHFASDGAAGIRGCGPAVVHELVASGLVRAPADLFALDEATLRQRTRLGAATRRGLIPAIALARTRPCARLIYGLGIPGVGRTGATRLGERFGSLAALAQASPSEVAQACGNRGNVARGLVGYLSDAETHRELEALARAIASVPP